MAGPFGQVVMAWVNRLRLVKRSELRCDATCKVRLPDTSLFQGLRTPHSSFSRWQDRQRVRVRVQHLDHKYE